MSTTLNTYPALLGDPLSTDHDNTSRKPLLWNIKHGDTIVKRTASQAQAEELFMERSRSRRMAKELREQIKRARRRRSKSTPVPLNVLEQLLTRIENADA